MKKARILIVDDETDILSGLKEFLLGEDFEVKTDDTGRDFLKLVKDFSPDLILLDITLGDISGYDLKEQLNKDIATAVIPVVFISVHKSFDYKRHSFNIGAQDHIVKPFDLEELIIRIDSILTHKKFYEDICMKDTLTGLYNRTHFEKQARILYGLATKYRQPFSMTVIDINGLKDINKRYGHEAGDFIITKTAEMIKKTIRSRDIATRYGGDEFTILLPDTDHKQAEALLDRLKKNIEIRDFAYNNSENIAFKISTGSASCISGELDLETMFSVIDLSIHVGKNRRQKAVNTDVLLLENDTDTVRKIKPALETEGFSVKKVFDKLDDIIKYVEEGDSENEPGYIILDLGLDRRFSPEFLHLLYTKWINTKVYLILQHIDYLDLCPYFRSIVSSAFQKSELFGLIEALKKDI
ncbi:MAG: diguanylate cyclase [Elusimicrobiota bacterium]